MGNGVRVEGRDLKAVVLLWPHPRNQKQKISQGREPRQETETENPNPRVGDQGSRKQGHGQAAPGTKRRS